MHSDREFDNIIMALLFASDEPLSVNKISSVLGEDSTAPVLSSLDRIRCRLDDDQASITLETVAGGYQLATRPMYAGYVARLYAGRRRQRLSRAALEALAIIAYKQPITRAEIEQIRGVGCGGVISTLMERSLIQIEGKARVLGAPFLYGTGREFLEYMGLNSLKDLPSIEELEEMLKSKVQTEESEEEEGTTLAADAETFSSPYLQSPDPDGEETSAGETIAHETGTEETRAEETRFEETIAGEANAEEASIEETIAEETRTDENERIE